MNERELMESGARPLPRDTSRFRYLAPDKRPVFPKGLKGQLSVLSTAELVNLRPGITQD